jgi:methyl-accepting chemotaxis protein WspA
MGIPRPSLRGRIILLAVSVAIVAVAIATALQMLTADAGAALLPRQWQAAAVAGFVAALLGVAAGSWIAAGIARPLADANDFADTIAAGDLAHADTVEPGNAGPVEVAELRDAVSHIAATVTAPLVGIRTAGARLQAAEATATAAVERQYQAARSFSDSAQEIATAVSEISATGEQLLAATSGVTAIAREAADVAEQGRGGLANMTASMQQLDEAMNAFTRKLATISQRAGGITAVVTTISKVAEQTNLLSVNATIEAEKAGESGRGFRIVAQEIRRLADQTAQATKDIERLVRDMQAAVAGGTMEMDRFRNEVSGRIGEVAGVSERLGRVIDPVQSVTRSLEQVHEGMEAQSQGARQIRDAMDNLRCDALESAASLAALSEALDAFRGAIRQVTAATEGFRLPDGEPEPGLPPVLGDLPTAAPAAGLPGTA